MNLKQEKIGCHNFIIKTTNINTSTLKNNTKLMKYVHLKSFSDIKFGLLESWENGKRPSITETIGGLSTLTIKGHNFNFHLKLLIKIIDCFKRNC